ncbi:MAG: PAS domain S-box protein, partial [Bacteroidia bacterium]|nr:PAS domain S-box protein [Bacteroidia bacterium]
SEIKGLHQSSLHPSDKKKDVTQGFAQDVQKRGGIVEVEIINQDKDRIPVEISSNVIDLSDDRSLIVGIFRDLRAQKKQEKRMQDMQQILLKAYIKAKRSEEKFRTIISAANDAIFLSDISTGLILDANHQAIRLSGYTLSEMKMKAYAQLFPSSTSSLYAWLSPENLQNSSTEPTIHEAEILHRDGYLIPVEISQSLVVISDDKFCVIGIFRDIRERKKAQAMIQKQSQEILQQNEELASANEEIIQTLEQLKRSEGRYRLLAESSTDFICLHLLDGTHEYVSPSLTRITGFNPEDLIGHSAYEYQLFHPEDIPKIRRAHQFILEGKGDVMSLECRGRKKDGNYLWLDTQVTAIRDETGKIYRIKTASRDITERKIYQQKLRARKEFLEQILDTLPIHVAIRNQQGRYRFINLSATKLADPEDLRDAILLTQDNEDKKLARQKSTLYDQLYPSVATEIQEREMLINGEPHYFVTGSRMIRSDTELPQLVLSYAFDISNQKRAELKLKRQLDFTNFISKIAADFINTSTQHLDKTIENTLRFVTQFAGVDRGYVFLFTKESEVFSIKHEWCRSEVRSHKSQITSYQYPETSDFVTALKQGRIIQKTIGSVTQTKDMPALEYMQRLGIQSYICLPLLVRGEFIGYLGFDSATEDVNWRADLVDAFNLTGQLIASALENKKAELALKRKK